MKKTSILAILLLSLLSTEVLAQNLVIAGGGPLSDEIRRHLVSLSDKENPQVLIIPHATAPDNWENRGEQQSEVFAELGAENSIALNLDDRRAAIRAIRESDVIWMPGGSQQRMMNALDEAGVSDEFRLRVAEGIPTGGTSAGAAVMSDVMIANSNRDEETGALIPVMSNGFGFWPDVIIDQHFSERNRLERLERAVQDHPNLTGIGIDESTAIVFNGIDFRVIGEGTVTVVKASSEDSGTTVNRILYPGDRYNIQ